ncbi:MAG: hypothetical protein ACKVH8_03495 [Pirellulales bacterium]
MKKLMFLLVFGFLVATVYAQKSKRPPEDLTLSIARVVDSEKPNEQLLIINGILAFQTKAGLEKYLTELPAGSKVTMDPGCCRIGTEPLIGSSEEMQAFQEFCKTNKIKLIVIPSG